MVEMLRKSDQAENFFPQWPVMLFTRRQTSVDLDGTRSVGRYSSPVGNRDGVEAEERLEAAIHMEMVLGDLNGAMQQYHTMAANSSGNATAARALYRYARCLEKLDRRTEAYDVYRRVAREYSDQAEATFARSRLADWKYSVSGPANLKFEQGATGKLPDAWFVPALPNDADHWAQLRRADCMNRDSCAVVLVPENAPVRVGNLMQSFNAAAYRGQNCACDCMVATGRERPEDRAQMWLGVDRIDDKKGFSMT